MVSKFSSKNGNTEVRRIRSDEPSSFGGKKVSVPNSTAVPLPNG